MCTEGCSPSWSLVAAHYCIHQLDLTKQFRLIHAVEYDNSYKCGKKVDSVTDISRYAEYLEESGQRQRILYEMFHITPSFKGNWIIYNIHIRHNREISQIPKGIVNFNFFELKCFESILVHSKHSEEKTEISYILSE